MFQGRVKIALSVTAMTAVILVSAALYSSWVGQHAQAASKPTTTQPFSNFVPEIAPSNPLVVYKLVPADDSSGQQVLARSTDGGATWRTFALPTVTGGTPTPLVVFVSPLDPQSVFLTVQVVFLSRDGGAHWSPIHLPASAAPAALGDSLGYITRPSALFSNGTTVFHVQGNRLYSATNVLPGSSPRFPEGESSTTIRIVVSTDGGLTWSYADEALAAQGGNICDYTAAPSGATLFAITSPACLPDPGIVPSFSLWRSDDAGAHWTKVQGGLLQSSMINGMVAVSDPMGQTPQILLYLTMAKEGNFSPANVHVSADGGQTWAEAPTAGFPVAPGPSIPVGVLSDGSVLFLAQTGGSGAAFFAWELGDAAWHQVGSGFNDVSIAFLVPGAAKDTICLVTGIDDSDFEIHTFSL